MTPPSPLLQVQDLHIRFDLEDRRIEAVRGVSLTLDEGETVAIVGESGSGKSVTALALTRLLPVPPARFVAGRIAFRGEDVLAMPPAELRKLRGGRIAYIFQEPSTSLNPVFTVHSQIAEALRLHRPEVTQVDEEVVHWLDAVGIRDAAKRMRDYPHQLSGGMQQRVMIAMALACRPDLLVADEPTTALDVTIQAQIMDLLASLKERFGMSVLLITHNFGIVAGFASRVIVMYRGAVVEEGPTAQVLREPSHPYTRALIACIPRLGARLHRLPVIDHEAIAAASGPAIGT